MESNRNSASPKLLPNSMSPYYEEDIEGNKLNAPMDFKSNPVSPIMLPSSTPAACSSEPQFWEDDIEGTIFTILRDFNNTSSPPNLSFMSTPYSQHQNSQDREMNSLDVPVDVNGNSVSLNPVPNSMLPPSYEGSSSDLPINFNGNSTSPNLMNLDGNSTSPNLMSNSMLVPSFSMSPYLAEIEEEQRLRLFWERQLFNIQIAEAFRNQQQFPFSRIRRIMKADPEVQMISAEIPMLMSKACEMFVQELTYRAWMRAEASNSEIVQPSDVAKVILHTNTLNFLTKIVPDDLLDDQEEENAQNIAEQSLATPAYPSGMENPIMNMENAMMDMEIPTMDIGNAIENPLMDMGNDMEIPTMDMGNSMLSIENLMMDVINPMMNVGNDMENPIDTGNSMMNAINDMENPIVDAGNHMLNVENAMENPVMGMENVLMNMENDMMTMDNDLEARNQVIPQPNIGEPPYMP